MFCWNCFPIFVCVTVSARSTYQTQCCSVIGTAHRKGKRGCSSPGLNKLEMQAVAEDTKVNWLSQSNTACIMTPAIVTCLMYYALSTYFIYLLAIPHFVLLDSNASGHIYNMIFLESLRQPWRKKPCPLVPLFAHVQDKPFGSTADLKWFWVATPKAALRLTWV